jgi:hypothetical protein
MTTINTSLKYNITKFEKTLREGKSSGRLENVSLGIFIYRLPLLLETGRGLKSWWSPRCLTAKL